MNNNDNTFITSFLDWGLVNSIIFAIFLFVLNLNFNSTSWNYYILNRGFILWHEYAWMGISLGIIIYAIYFAITLFVKWLIAWKPLPKFIPTVAKTLLLILILSCVLLEYVIFYQNKNTYFNLSDKDKNTWIKYTVDQVPTIILFFTIAITIIAINFLVYTYRKNHPREIQ